jgi:hypothetical protein
MSFGVLGEYAKSLFASSLCTQRFFPRIFRIRLYSFRPETILCTANNPSLLCSPYTLTLWYFLRIFLRHLNTFRVFSRKNEEYSERIFHHQQCLGTSKGQCFEKIEWGVNYLPRMNSLQINFLVIFKTKTALCVYGEYNGEISTLSVYISVNTNRNLKKI